MPRLRTYKTEAVVLKQMSLGEADRILTLYTPDMGLLRAVAKGIRRTKSKFGGHLELLNQVSVSLSRGRNLDIVTEAQGISRFRGLKEDLQSLSKALYIAEMVDGFSAEQLPNHDVYRLLLDVLARLSTTSQPDLLLRYFEMRLLEYSGYRPEFHSCVDCRAILEPGDHFFSPSSGGVLCPNCRPASGHALIPISLNAMKVLRFLQREKFADVEGLKVPRNLLGEVERTLRVYIRFLMEKEMKTAEFMYLVSDGRGRASSS